MTTAFRNARVFKYRNGRRRRLVATATLVAGAALASMPAHAFLNDLIGVGVELGGKLLGAGVDKAKESLKDPEEEARQKQAAQEQQLKAFNSAVAAVEDRTDLSALQKERAVRQLHKQFDLVNRIAAMEEQAQARRKAQRDRIFTAEGMLDTVGNAAVSAASTRIALARADGMVAAGIPQAQTKSVLNQVDAGAASETADQTRRMLAMSAAASSGSTTEPPTAQPKGSEGDAPSQVPSVDVATEGQPAADTEVPVTTEAPPAPPVTAFTPDLAKKVALVFVGAPKAQKSLTGHLTSLGHQVVEDAASADVVYRIEGEYLVPESRQYSGTRQSFGEILDAEAIGWQPEKKMAGTFGAGIAKFMLAVGKAQGAQVPSELQGGPSDHLKQVVLLVVSREPKEGKPTRVSFSREASSPEVQAVPLVRDTYADMLAQLGVAQ